MDFPGSDAFVFQMESVTFYVTCGDKWRFCLIQNMVRFFTLLISDLFCASECNPGGLLDRCTSLAPAPNIAKEPEVGATDKEVRPVRGHASLCHPVPPREQSAGGGLRWLFPAEGTGRR